MQEGKGAKPISGRRGWQEAGIWEVSFPAAKGQCRLHITWYPLAVVWFLPHLLLVSSNNPSSTPWPAIVWLATGCNRCNNFLFQLSHDVHNLGLFWGLAEPACTVS
ncbi:uncharacterized protein BO87DRAFT_179745 [Aspergillus neoniger CBS 115656]|uniref:Uncharacterized protein n=1 Tax=Aspergillus neoniger (strain CBS 115656) TaxID=1448310 RepID=A0A318Y5D7_ASPNB|nr:hypothetical protein BO87DRAFT_179745 [Aspergillus neoniger CBS 115656]PYH29471.1 hypothetical protein BO87DRAFT_179745 [Aspergillus neoniger CBS 115656]